MSSAQEQQPQHKSRAKLTVTIIAVAVLVILFFIFANLYTDVLWYAQLGFLNVLTTQWLAGGLLFVIGFLAMAIPVWVSIQLAYRLRPVYAKLNDQLDRYQEVIEPLRKLAMWGIPAVFGFFAGVSASTHWQETLIWLNRTPTGKTDPQFGLDISFYLFELGFYHSVLAFASAVVILSGLAAIATSYLYGAFRVRGREVRISKSARVQLAITAAVYLALQAASIWFDQYSTLTETGQVITGASYADVNATIPGRAILAGIAALVAILFIVTAVNGRWRLPIIGTALLLVSGLLIGAVYPWVVQKFQVDPTELTMEEPYIQRNIEMTREAYGVSDVEEIPYKAKTDAEPNALRNDAATTANIRIIDPALVSATFGQLQQFRQYYSFPKRLDVDRYKIGETVQDTVIAVRELNQAGLGGSQTWYNNTVVYTHGYGVVAAFGNQRSVDGQPVFLESGIPTTGKLGEFQPRIYFGENSPLYSIVGKVAGAKDIELDYPSGSEGTQQQTTFDGDGGPKLDNIFKRLIFALKFQSEQIVLSDAVSDSSQILYDRDPIQRVQKVAPYLILDSDAYPTVVDGRVKWVVDAYTTSNRYPYSHIESLSSAITDTETPPKPFALDDINYMRNSVKATVDAYDGSVTLYVWDENDPILETWQKIFPATTVPLSEMSADLMSHVRYPADLFKVQRSVLGLYHVTDAQSFYQRDDAWVPPNDPTSPAGNPTTQPPYFLTLQMPGQKQPSFSLYTTYIPLAAGDTTRNVLTGYLAADADAGSTKGVRADTYGKLRMLVLPKDVTIPGPGQVQASFDSDTSVSTELNLLRQGQTKVLNGNLLTLPVGGGLLYVQPVYVESTGETGYPLLQKVLVAFGDKIAFEATLDTALDTLFGGSSGASAGDNALPPDTPGAKPVPSPTTPGTASEAVTAALKEAQTALLAKQAALAKGDWTAYGEADAALAKAIEAAIAAEGGSTTPAPSPAPSPAP
ncbi:UPF0182 family protein [Homoserinimonas sp. OAct 916]|uniref:UPF0182 family membrane protein n=1 Tax=Homoserinimonas sp. OAct 916 TaxID=2211450 RepID=UPI000DBE656C|nr:UPF0182 family protein [Homoserinimonas sp. OAct 916]